MTLLSITYLFWSNVPYFSKLLVILHKWFWHLSIFSGGQQRRVSFASAIIHKPPLVILDEPTVGVDPLLRKRWVSYMQIKRKTKPLKLISLQILSIIKEVVIKPDFKMHNLRTNINYNSEDLEKSMAFLLMSPPPPP